MEERTDLQNVDFLRARRVLPGKHTTSLKLPQETHTKQPWHVECYTR